MRVKRGARAVEAAALKAIERARQNGPPRDEYNELQGALKRGRAAASRLGHSLTRWKRRPYAPQHRRGRILQALPRRGPWSISNTPPTPTAPPSTSPAAPPRPIPLPDAPDTAPQRPHVSPWATSARPEEWPCRPTPSLRTPGHGSWTPSRAAPTAHLVP